MSVLLILSFVNYSTHSRARRSRTRTPSQYCGPHARSLPGSRSSAVLNPSILLRNSGGKLGIFPEYGEVRLFLVSSVTPAVNDFLIAWDIVLHQEPSDPDIIAMTNTDLQCKMPMGIITNQSSFVGDLSYYQPQHVPGSWSVVSQIFDSAPSHTGPRLR